MSDDTPTRPHRAPESDAERLLMLEMAREEHRARIKRLEHGHEATEKALAAGAVTMAVMRRDVRVLVWISSVIGVAVIGAIVTAVAKLLGA